MLKSLRETLMGRIVGDKRSSKQVEEKKAEVKAPPVEFEMSALEALRVSTVTRRV
ncbi:hypothetical protein ONV78_18105 [Hahella sp. CR1]|uniref:hypothetical protein n=1 Tax=Hahella sp. CR1 TaxID=2992807 RepID=UPI002441EE61|nr:hypothetical protein [Hahella sp. CR1]MDG9669653.1 hypothetical protein [Hahella sp. CR1]